MKGFMLILVMLAVGCIARAEQPTPQFLGAALRYQEQICPVLEVSYTWSDPKGKSGLFHYARTPTMFFAEQNLPAGSAPGQIQAVFDRGRCEFRSLYKLGDSVSGDVGNEPNGILATQTVMETALYYVYDGYLYEVVDKGTVSGKENVGDDSCWRVESTGEFVKYVIWLDPEIGFCPRRLEIRWPKKESSLKTVEFLDYAEIAKGSWFPAKIHHVFTEGDKTRLEMLAALQTISTKQTKEIPAIVFPKGIPVGNAGLGRLTP